MRSICLFLFVSLFGFITLTNAQNGSAGQPFTSLGQAQNVASDGVYYFSLSGTSFSTYVRVGGWVQVAVDFGDGVGNLPQSNALNNTVRGILSTSALSTLGSATVTRVLTSNGQLDVQNTRPGIITRIVNNQTLLATPADNTDNGGNWTGTNTIATQFTNGGNTQAYGLNLNIFHAGNNGDGIHWIPFYNQQMIKFSAGDIPNGTYFQLLVRAPMVAVVSGPVINTQPSTSAQSVCLNAAINALSVSATSPNGSAITYQWYSNASASNVGGTSIGGASSSSFTPPNNVAGTVYYYVICTNNQASTTSTVSAGITVNAIPQAAANSGSVDYLVVGGGGGGGFDGAGGGGGGQVKTGTLSLASGSYAVTIGNGGANATSFGAQAGNGGSTTLSFPTPIVSIGGGGGGSKGANGATGGNGGGGGHSNYAGAAGAAGGFAGGNANGDGGGGGGGAGTAGATGSAGRNGGDGVLSSISGSATYYGGGGGGGTYGSSGTALGGLGGGGRGGVGFSPLAVVGTPNTGGGGGGAGEAQSNPGRSGGSGVVIVRYLGSPSGTGGTITQSGGYTIHTFNSNGTFAYNGSSSAVVPNVTVCSSTSATFTSTLAAGLTLDWYDAPTNGNLLSQGTSTYTTPVLASTTTYYVAVRNVSAGCVSATRTAVTATVNATSFTSTTGASRCGTGTVTLQAATAAGTINWYAALTGGASLGTGTSFNTPSIAATTTYYADVTNNGCTSSPRTAVVATVNAIPTFSSTTGASICGTSTGTLQATTAAGTINWYAALTGGASLGTGTSYTTPSIATTTTYYADVTNNGCTSSPRTSVVATVNSLPQAAGNSGTSVDYLVVGGGGGGGHEGGGGGGGGQVKTGSVSFLNGSFAVTIGNGGAGATTISSQASNGGTTTLSLPTPVVSIGGGGGGSKNAQGASGGNGGGGGHPGFSGGAGAAGGFAGGTANNEIGGGGAGAGAVGTSASNSNGGIGVSSSISGSATFYGGGGGGGSWHIGTSGGQGGQGGGGSGGTALSPLATSGAANTGGGGGGSGNSQSTAVAKNGGSGIVIVRYLGSPSGTGGTITQSGGYTIHTFNSNGTFTFNNPSTAVVSGVTVCGSTSATFTGTVAAGFTLDWYDAASGGNLLSQGTLTYTTPALASTTIYYVAVRNVSTGCVSATRTAVTATVNTTSFTSTTGASRCGTGTVTLQAATAAGTINWYSALTGGASLGAGTSFTTPSIAATTTYYVQVTNNGCTTNPRVAVVATVNATPPTPTITQSGCGVLTLGNYGSGNALDLGAYNSSKYVTIPATLNSTINTNNITLEGWFYFTSLVANTNYLPMLIGEAYNVDANITFCMHRQGNIIIAGFYNGGWQAASSSTFIPINTWIHIASTYDQNQIKLYFNGVLNSTFNSNQTLPISGNQPWYLGKRWDHLETLGGVMDEIRIWNVARTQAQIQASMNSTVPTNSTGLRAYYKLDEITGNIASDATGNGYDGTLSNGPTWQVPSTSILGGPQATFLWSPGGQTTNTITAATSGTYSVVATTSGCQSASASSSVVLGVTASSNQTICSGTSPANLTLTGTAATIQWQSSTDNSNFTNIGGATSATLSSAQMGNLNATTYYRAYATSAVCAPSYSNTVTITVNTTPSFTSTTGASRCGTGTVTLQAATAAGTINWYAALTGGASLGTGTSFNTPSIAATTTYYADVTNNGCTSSPRTAVVATVNAIPTFSSTTGASICGTGTATLQAATAAGTINWYAALTGGASLGTGTSYTTPSIATTTTYYVDVTDNGCTSSPRTAVVATVNALPLNLNSYTADVLVVGGGGSGGYRHAGGGGGGGVVYQTSFVINAGNIPVTIGNGGVGNSVNSVTGQNSIFSSITAFGGGGGGDNGLIGKNGGSGGGGSNGSFGGSGVAGQGFKGGDQNNGLGCCHGIGAGGGGAGAAGANTNGAAGSAGGIGLPFSISGTSVYYGGGGGGGSSDPTSLVGGIGGGGNGGTSSSLTGNAGTPNTGGGGGGGGASGGTSGIGGNGGSGIVIIRYAGTPAATGGTITQVGGFTIHTFTSNGTFTLAGGASASVPNVTSCGAAAVTFTGTVNAGFTLDWYDAANGGNLLSQGTSTYTTPVISTTTTYYVAVRNTTTGCVSAARTAVTATVITASTASSSQTVCPGLLPSAITLTNYGGTLQWQTSNDNVTFTNIAGQTSATLPANAIGIMAGTKYIRAMVTNGACVTPSNVVTLSPANVNVLTPLTASSYVWNGQSSSDWGTLSNWYSYNGTSLVPAATLPGSTANTIIPANTGCILTQPTLSSGAIIINSLVLETGSQLTQSGGSLLLYTNLVKNGNIVSTGGLINFYGPTSATISGSGAVQFTKMRVNKLAGASLTLQIPVTVSDSLTMILGNIYTTTNNLLTLGLNSASPGKLAYTSGTVVGPLKRFFANAAISGLAGRFPVGTATYNRYAQFSFASSPGIDQSLTVNYASGAPLSGGNILYNGLPLWASNSLMQNYSADGYWNVIPSNNDYTSTINTAPYEVTLFANNLTGMQTPQVCRIIKSAGSNTAAQNHVAWSACGTHTAIAGGANPLAFLISSTASQGFSWFNIGTPNSQALPVEFAGMTTTCEEEAISIRWSTESEHNNDYFRIEKSADGGAWDILGYVDAVGNSSVINGYEYLDVEYRSNSYYRLYQVDQDGSEELLSTLYTDCDVATDEITSFPNPSHESFSIFWKQFNTSGDGTITIRDINGKTMHHETVALSLGANLFIIKEHLAPGVYMIELMDDNYERRLIKHVVK